MPKLEGLKNEALLSAFIKQWENYAFYVFHFRKIVVYIDRYFLSCLDVKVSLATTAVRIFRELCSNQIYEKLNHALIALINDLRSDEGVILIKRSVKALSEIGFTYPDIVKYGES